MDSLTIATSLLSVPSAWRMGNWKTYSPLYPIVQSLRLRGLLTKKADLATVWGPDQVAQLCSCFGGLALLMACVGLYGTMAQDDRTAQPGCTGSNQ